jgi:hypothetical protein
MKYLLSFLLFFVLSTATIIAQESSQTLVLTGASFATSNNGWFEFACEKLDVIPFNRAVSGESIVHTAEKMNAGTFYSNEEFERIDALVIMHVHEKDVYNDPHSRLREKYSDYGFPMDMENYVGAYDYVIKRYVSDCYNLKYDSASVYFNTPHGKPAIIVLCTHWHDSRVTFNTTVRQLAQKWGLPVVEFDKNIGFSKEQLHPVSNKQYSLIYAYDTQEQNGIIYGWHPLNGDTYIQRKMATIFARKMMEVLP